ncbi:MAG: ABC transporter ATP-binding protein, partial [Chloroflexota bacterium]|nr:ABC transporter ATP-binding protein [Chloroflexota bacterium]
MPPIIEVERLHKTYGTLEAVRDVSFTVQHGEIFGILGPNGAGKTTTVECVQGLREPTSGSIRILGIDAIRNRQQLRRRIGSQLQESALPDRIKVWEALDLFASLEPGGPDWRVLLDQWGLGAKAKSSFASLSGGQRQRLFVALALINNPEVVFLDELTQGLDPSARRVAWDLIRAIRERGSTVVIVTHYMDEAEQLCDRLAVIAGGHVIATGTPQELIASSPRGLQVRFSTANPDVSWLERIDEVTAVTRRGDSIAVSGTGPVLALTAAALVAHGTV